MQQTRFPPDRKLAVSKYVFDHFRPKSTQGGRISPRRERGNSVELFMPAKFSTVALKAQNTQESNVAAKSLTRKLLIFGTLPG